MLISTEGWRNELTPRLASSFRGRARVFVATNAWKTVVVAVNFAYRMESAHRCTGLLFITMRISHLATVRSGRSLAAHRNQFGEYKNDSFSSPNHEYLLYFCVQGRATIHVQGHFNNDAVVRRQYSAIGYYSNLSNASLGEAELLPPKYIIAFALFNRMITDYLQHLSIYLLFYFIFIPNAIVGNLNSDEEKISSKTFWLENILKEDKNTFNLNYFSFNTVSHFTGDENAFNDFSFNFVQSLSIKSEENWDTSLPHVIYAIFNYLYHPTRCSGQLEINSLNMKRYVKWRNFSSSFFLPISSIKPSTIVRSQLYGAKKYRGDNKD